VPPRNRPKKETGLRKAAILMIALGPEVAADIYRSLSDREIEMITIEIANSGAVTPDMIAEVMEEFYHTAMAKQYMAHGGLTTAKDILEKALGPGKAMEVIERLQGVLLGNPFDFLKHIDPGTLCQFVKNEHPQTIALVLSHLNYDQAAIIMQSLEPDMQSEVSLRIATMSETSPEIISEVERVLERKLSNVISQEVTISGGIDALAELINRVDQKTQKSLIEKMELQEPVIAAELKKQLFTFDDIGFIDDRALQRMLNDIDTKDLATALKGANNDVQNQIFRNMSSRAATMLREDMEMLGPIQVKRVEESQQKIISALRKMEENGEITISRSDEETFI
jgi:flagellar motor switch protein FliG